MAAFSDFSNVEVYVWLPRDTAGNFSNSAKGGFFDKKSMKTGGTTAATVGHVAMRMCHWNSDTPPPNSPHLCTTHCVTEYVSFWPASEFKKDDPRASLGYDILLNSLSEDKIMKKGMNPDAIICMSRLNVPKMIDVFNNIKLKVQNNEIYWTYKITSGTGIPYKKGASCATLVFRLLRQGGIYDKALPYQASSSLFGPKDKAFYATTKCDAGDIPGKPLKALQLTLSPKFLLYRVASAVEGHLPDKQMTEVVMNSDRVFGWQPPSNPNVHSEAPIPPEPFIFHPPGQLPAIAFGKEMWVRYFGDVGVVPPLPRNIDEILNTRCPFWEGLSVYQTHRLVLMPEKVNGQPYNVELFMKLNGNLIMGMGSDKIEYKSPGQSYWMLITEKSIVKGLRDLKSYSKIHGRSFSEKFIKTNLEILREVNEASGTYTFPTVLEMVTAIQGTSLLSGKSLSFICESNELPVCEETLRDLTVPPVVVSYGLSKEDSKGVFIIGRRHTDVRGCVSGRTYARLFAVRRI